MSFWTGLRNGIRDGIKHRKELGQLVVVSILIVVAAAAKTRLGRVVFAILTAVAIASALGVGL